jgi:hypothetical protein
LDVSITVEREAGWKEAVVAYPEAVALKSPPEEMIETARDLS